MRIDHFKIFDKKGNNLNLFTVYDINIGFNSQPNSLGAEAFAITDTDGYISDIVIKSAGWEYLSDTTVSFSDPILGETRILSPGEATVNFIDVSIFNPLPKNSKGIDSVVFTITEQYYYPVNKFTGAIFTTPVSTELVETEHLAIFMDNGTGGLMRPYDVEDGNLIFKFIDGDSEIKLFEINEDTQTIIWTEELIYDISEIVQNEPIIINIGFKASEEGIFERRLMVYHRLNGIDYIIGELIINSQSIGVDERFNTLIENFGLPNPKNTPHLFKESDINEALPDWKLLNYKSKHMVLEHSKIMPYIGTYKGLINSIKWLGYEDIKIKEWFKNVKDNTKLSLYVPYEAVDRTKTILYFSPEERKNLKKLNELSLIYCITKETGEIDEWGTPIVEECYNYTINEILIKLRSLKEWLERNIIGVNARIIDISGEGVYYERYKNIIYATQDRGHRLNCSMSLTPITLDDNSELISGDSSIKLSLLELQQFKFSDFENLKYSDLINYYWDPSNGAFNPADVSTIDPSTIFVGNTFAFPVPNLYDIQWVASVKKDKAGILCEEFVTKPLFIYDNDIKFANSLDVSTLFYDISTNLNITIEKGFLRDPSIDLWEDNISYSIYPNFYIRMDASSTKTFLVNSEFTITEGAGFIQTREGSIAYNASIEFTTFLPDISTYIQADTSTKMITLIQNGYVIESSIGTVYYLNSELALNPSTNSSLIYAFDPNYFIPLFIINGYKWSDNTGNTKILEKPYYLEILDGNIKMEKYVLEPSSLMNDSSLYKKEEYFINFNYDLSSNVEQEITLNVEYSSPRFSLYTYDPSIYFHVGPNEALLIDNSIYNFNINHIGNYNIKIYGWDGNNTLYNNFITKPYSVWNKLPIIYNYTDIPINCDDDIYTCHTSILSVEDISILTAENKYPLFDKEISLFGLKLEQDNNDNYYISIPSISYFIDNPDEGSIAKFFNLTEKCSSINITTGDIIWDPDYQKLYAQDLIKLVKIDNGSHTLITEVSTQIITADNNTGLCQVTFVPDGISIDSSSSLYILNNTERPVYSIVNDFDNRTVSVDISTYEFTDNQLVNLLIIDLSYGYKWGSSFRAIGNANLNPGPSYSGILHTFEGNIPEFVEANPGRYIITAKSAWSTYADFNIKINNSVEEDGYFKIYLDDTYLHQYYLDNTFVYVNILFDQNKVINQWYDPSTDSLLIDNSMYSYTNSITIDISTLVILDSHYDLSTYLLNGRNIWTVTNHMTNETLFRVFNKSVPYIFEDSGTFDVKLESYDSYGNINEKFFEGLIIVKDE